MLMNPIIPIVSAAMMLGLVSGLTPGPLLTLVVTEAFRKGFRSGAAVAVAPLITDVPIILVMTILVDSLNPIGWIFGCLYLLGSCYLVWLVVEVFRFKGDHVETNLNYGASFFKGVVVNVTNPAPYIFWFTIGSPLLVQAKNISWSIVVLFLVIFYGMLVGSKLLLAGLIGKNRHLLSGRIYTTVMRLLGVALLVFAFLFIKNGIEKLT
jgi:threonine/homoserine/homoserine lactone efflux protein